MSEAEQGLALAPRHRVGARLRWAALTALAFAVAYFSIQFTRDTGRAAALWPLNAVFLAFILRAPRRTWVQWLSAFLVGNAGANLASGDSMPVAALLVCANLLEIIVVAHLMTLKGPVRLLRRSAILRFAGSATVGCLASSALALTLFEILELQRPLHQAAVWFAADFLGLLLVTPVLWILLDGSRTAASKARAAPPVELAFVTAVTFGVFAQSEFPLLFLVAPALVYLAMRRGLKGACGGVIVVTAVSLGFTVIDRGPTMLIDDDPQIRILVTQVFLIANILMALSVGAASADRQRLIRSLKAAKTRTGERYRGERILVQQAQLAERMGQIGYWTLKPATGEIFWSPEVYRIHGVDPDAFDPNLEDALAFFVGADRRRVADEISRATEAGKGWHFEADLKKPDGEIVRVRSMAECKRNAVGDVEVIFGVFKDVTQDYEILNRTLQQEALYRLLADNSSDLIARYGTDSVFTYLSPSTETLLGYAPDELIGRETSAVIHPDDLDHVRRTWRAGLASARPFSVEYRARRKDGAIIWVEARPTVTRDPSGNILDFIDTVRDVTDRHEREIALAEATSAAQAATKAKAEFLSNMSHEIRTPLNGVIGFANLLLDTGLTSTARRYAERIANGASALREIVDDILDFSKIEAGMMQFETTAFSPAAVVEEVLDLVRAANSHPDLILRAAIADDARSYFDGDPARTRQILFNIIGNAAKFTGRGRVEADLSVQDGLVRFVVTDTGPGIAADRLESIFASFTQVDSSVSRRFGGSGLGLTISRSLARSLGGDLRLASTPGSGTVVTLELPAVLSSVFPSTPPLRLPARPNRTDRPRRILVVDDVDSNRELLTIALGQAGHTVDEAPSGSVAVAKLAIGHQYDLVLMDVHMPGMDGLTATRAIRASGGPSSRAPIVGLTASVMADQVAACIAAGMDGHMGKPVDLGRLIAFIDGMSDAPRLGQAAPVVLDGSPDFEALRNRYRDHLKTIHALLDAAVADKSLSECTDQIATIAHTLAGSSGNLGFNDVALAARRLEAACRERAAEARLRRLVAALKGQCAAAASPAVH